MFGKVTIKSANVFLSIVLALIFFNTNCGEGLKILLYETKTEIGNKPGGDPPPIPKTWTHPTGLTDYFSFTGSHAIYSDIAMDTNGNTIAIWQQQGPVIFQVFRSEYRSGSWTHPFDINDFINPAAQSINTSRLAMDNNGNAIIVWSYSDGINDQVFRSEYRSGSWTDPANFADNISPDAQDALYPQVAMDNNGNAIIVWEQSNGTNRQVFISEYRSGSWTDPADLNDNISQDGQHVYSPQVAMDDNGNAIIVWFQSDGANTQVFKSEYRSGSWTDPANLGDNISPDGEGVNDPQVAMDNSGNAIIVWSQSNGLQNQIFKSEYRSGSWTDPANLGDNISPDGQQTANPMVAMDNNGNAIIAWKQFDSANDQIFISEYRSGSWTHPANIGDNISPDGETAIFARVAMDGNGDAIIIWQQSDGLNDQIFKSEYRDGSWTHPANLDDNISPDGQNCSYPELAIDNNGNAGIVWQQMDSARWQIFKSEYR